MKHVFHESTPFIRQSMLNAVLALQNNSIPFDSIQSFVATSLDEDILPWPRTQSSPCRFCFCSCTCTWSPACLFACACLHPPGGPPYPTDLVALLVRPSSLSSATQPTDRPIDQSVSTRPSVEMLLAARRVVPHRITPHTNMTYNQPPAPCRNKHTCDVVIRGLWTVVW